MKINTRVQKLNSSQLSSAKVIAVTGQMAAGKNYVCKLLEESGWASVDCDILVHQAIDQASDEIYNTFQQDAKEYGIELKSSDGNLNRRAIGKLVFQKPEFLAKQESIVYPIITQMAEDFINQHPKTILNATVLYKTPSLLENCEVVLFVTAPLVKRLFRAYKRDKLPTKQILQRFKNQRHLLQQYKNTGKKIIIVKN